MSDLKILGFQHVATVTNDLDGLTAFYRDVFGADVVRELDAPPGAPFSRHALIELGEGVALHPFEKPDVDLDGWGATMLDQGRLDHFAVRVADRPSFDRLRERLMAVGASDGTITDFTALLSVHYVDPDGLHAEVCWVRPDVPMSAVKEPDDFVARV